MPLTIEKKNIKNKETEEIPNYLVKEVIDGIPFYYKGYEQVLNKTKTLEDIMGCSGLQSAIIEYLLATLFIHLDRKKFRVFTNEAGNQIGHKNNLSYDLAIFDKAVLLPEKITNKYVDVPPEIVIEVDIDIELKGTGIDMIQDFIFLKTEKVFEFGVKKMIWILSRSKKVIIAEKEQTWQIFDWHHDLKLLNDITFNIAQYLKEEGIKV